MRPFVLLGFAALLTAAEPGWLDFPLHATVVKNEGVTVHVAWPVAADGKPAPEAPDIVYYQPWWNERNFATDHGVFEELAKAFTVVGIFLNDQENSPATRRTLDPENGPFAAIEEAIEGARTRLQLPPHLLGGGGASRDLRGHRADRRARAGEAEAAGDPDPPRPHLRRLDDQVLHGLASALAGQLADAHPGSDVGGARTRSGCTSIPASRSSSPSRDCAAWPTRVRPTPASCPPCPPGQCRSPPRASPARPRSIRPAPVHSPTRPWPSASPRSIAESSGRPTRPRGCSAPRCPRSPAATTRWWCSSTRCATSRWRCTMRCSSPARARGRSR